MDVVIHSCRAPKLATNLHRVQVEAVEGLCFELFRLRWGCVGSDQVQQGPRESCSSAQAHRG